MLPEGFVVVFSSIFGINITDVNDFDVKTSTRIVLFVTFLNGSVFFYFYGGFLTSVLAIPSEAVPFTTPEGLLKTNYR